ncbi:MULTISPECIES: AbrB family transcriptional regulator [Lactobacillaceae]|uniref:AbrB/MazE/SpoVT family DNA-binding domain-containing protein n=1 Tax=Lactobacillaceae TaxID=33958 RepID=UPI001B3B2943|nr:AbrB family transcriptional regulator [Lactobacillus sp. HBUAS51381]
MQDAIRIKAKLSSKNQLTVPKAIRDSLGLADQDKVVFQLINGTVTLKKDNDFWTDVKKQAQTYGNLSTDELDWGPSAGEEVIPK